jgi:hypothetical protein
MGQAHAPRTIAGRRSGLRHWALFTLLMGWKVRLFDSVEEQNARAIVAAEGKIMCFARYLARDYKSATVIKYCHDVQAQHMRWIGVPLKALGVVFYRLPLLFKWAKKVSPGKVRTKRGWESSWFQAVRQGWLQGRQLFDACRADYEKGLVYVIMVLAFEQLLRLSEVTRTAVASVSEYGTIMVRDAVGITFEGERVPLSEKFWQNTMANGDPSFTDFEEVQLKMPPSKCNMSGGGVLRCPVNAAVHEVARCRSSGFVLLTFMAAHVTEKVPTELTGVVPLFRERPVLPPATVGVLRATRFMSVMRQMCRAAQPEVWYTGLGMHCFRVGGCNRLIELGASVAQIMALGRWASACWELYGRRNSATLLQWSSRMAFDPGMAQMPKLVSSVEEGQGVKRRWREGGGDHRWIGRRTAAGRVVAWLPETSTTPAKWRVVPDHGDRALIHTAAQMHMVLGKPTPDEWSVGSSGSETDDTDWDSDGSCDLGS